MENKLLDYRSERDYLWLMKQVRFKSSKKLKIRLLLSEGMVIKTSPQRCMANLLIFRLLDYYKVSDNRQEYIFTGSYLKNQPIKYMTKVLDMIEEDSSFRYGQTEDDFVILLPHVMSEVKEVFYKLSIMVDGILMTDHSLWSYIKGYRECKEFANLMDNPIIEENDAPWIIERKMKAVLDLFDNKIDIHPLSDFYRSGVKVNRGQLMMFICWS